MIGLLYQLCAVAYIMEKNSVSNRIKRYVDVISAKLHDLNRDWPFMNNTSIIQTSDEFP